MKTLSSIYAALYVGMMVLTHSSTFHIPSVKDVQSRV